MTRPIKKQSRHHVVLQPDRSGDLRYFRRDLDDLYEFDRVTIYTAVSLPGVLRAALLTRGEIFDPCDCLIGANLQIANLLKNGFK